MKDHRIRSLGGWVLDNDQDIDGPNGWIQWKGTSVCMDLHCVCGRMEHYDGDFFYFYECRCGRKYGVGMNVKLIELTPEILERYKTEIAQTDFKKDDSDDSE